MPNIDLFASMVASWSGSAIYTFNGYSTTNWSYWDGLYLNEFFLILDIFPNNYGNAERRVISTGLSRTTEKADNLIFKQTSWRTLHIQDSRGVWAYYYRDNAIYTTTGVGVMVGNNGRYFGKNLNFFWNSCSLAYCPWISWWWQKMVAVAYTGANNYWSYIYKINETTDMSCYYAPPLIWNFWGWRMWKVLVAYDGKPIICLGWGDSSWPLFAYNSYSSFLAPNGTQYALGVGYKDKWNVQSTWCSAYTAHVPNGAGTWPSYNVAYGIINNNIIFWEKICNLADLETITVPDLSVVWGHGEFIVMKVLWQNKSSFDLLFFNINDSYASVKALMIKKYWWSVTTGTATNLWTITWSTVNLSSVGRIDSTLSNIPPSTFGSNMSTTKTTP